MMDDNLKLGEVDTEILKRVLETPMPGEDEDE
jgi:hypothetical protein